MTSLENSKKIENINENNNQHILTTSKMQHKYTSIHKHMHTHTYAQKAVKSLSSSNRTPWRMMNIAYGCKERQSLFYYWYIDNRHW